MAEVAQSLLPDVMQWADAPGKEQDETLEQLTETLSHAINTDGYALAQALDRDHCWQADAELVEIMERVDFLAMEFADKKTLAWVKENDVQPTLQIGDHVRWQHGFGEQRTGRIVFIDLEMARYTIQEDGREYKQSISERPLGWLVNYEKVVEVIEKVGVS